MYCVLLSGSTKGPAQQLDHAHTARGKADPLVLLQLLLELQLLDELHQDHEASLGQRLLCTAAVTVRRGNGLTAAAGAGAAPDVGGLGKRVGRAPLDFLDSNRFLLRGFSVSVGGTGF